MATLFRKEKQHALAIQVLQMGQFKWLGHELLALELTQNYLAIGQTFSAALVLEESARKDLKLSYEASELLRQVGKSYRARYLNLLTTDPQKKLKQKVALYLEDSDYQSMNSLLPQLKHHSLLDDQDLRYAMAYSLYRSGEIKRARRLLTPIDREDLYEKAVELKKEMAKCDDGQWSCYETI